MTAMKVNNVKLITRYSRAGIQALARGAALAGAGDHCYLMKGTFEEAGGPQEAAVLTVPLCGRHSLFLAGPLAPDAGERFGDSPKKVYGVPARVLDAALRENPEGRSVEIYVGERETDVLGIGFDGSRPGWEEVRAGAPDVILPGQETDLWPELGERYLEKHLVTEYLSAAMRLFLDVADQTGYQDDILVRGRPAWFPTASCPSLVASVPTGKGSEIGLTAEYVGRAPKSWALNHIEILRLPRDIVERVATHSAGSRVRMILGSSEGAYCRIESPEGKYQKCLGSLPRFPHSFPLPKRRGTGSNRNRDERIRSPGPLPAARRIAPAGDEGTISPVLPSIDKSQE
ncbi:hypothetical protein [Methanoculleus sp.]|uniref:hypothetical protein n=1 Tax=Methanoculleus sp. TaxID=90427 RepID=UPI0025E6DB2C|nr:hypothetical protein [Methanoculleus sp.]